MAQKHVRFSSVRESVSWLVIRAAFVCSVVLYALLSIPYSRIFNTHQRSTKTCGVYFNDGDKKLVLFWTKFFDSPDFEVGTCREPFIKAGCDHYGSGSGTCFTTTERQFFNDSTAVVFHARDLNPNDLPPPSWRSPNQLYVFYNLESPVHTDLDLLRDSFGSFFNITFTYRRDSDVVNYYYGRLKAKKSTNVALDDYPLPINSERSVVRPAGHSISNRWIHKKNKTIAWFVSNCETDSKRELLVKQLNKHIQVDEFGRCSGSVQCSNTNCNEMLRDSYRFYLSFENSLCPDYVTEKLYRALANNVVPIVYGGADYSSYLPLGSFVDATSFDNASHLASFLNSVIENDTLYSSYFDWKEFYEVIENPFDSWCELCNVLRREQPVEKVYADIAAWWSTDSMNRSCVQPEESLLAPIDKSNFLYSSINKLIRRLIG